MASPSPWTGRAWMGAGAALFSGSSGDNEPHRHHALQVVVGLECEATVVFPGLAPIQSDGVAIPADTPHALSPGLVGLLYLEPESLFGAALTGSADNPGAPYSLDGGVAKRLRVRFSSTDEWTHAEILVRNLVEDIAGTAMPHVAAELDTRVQTAISVIDARLAEPPPLAELARAAAASESHLRKLFRKQVGLSIKRYRLWAKLRHALALLLGGASLTTCAHAAGFADAAHLTRTFREMFGTTPTNALRELKPPGE